MTEMRAHKNLSDRLRFGINSESAAYYLNSGKYATAFECFAQLNRWDEAIDSLYMLLVNRKNEDDVIFVLNLLDSIPHDYCDSSPHACSLYGICYLIGNNFKNAEERLYRAINLKKKIKNKNLHKDAVISLGILELLCKNPAGFIFFRMSKHLNADNSVFKLNDYKRLFMYNEVFIYEGWKKTEYGCMIKTVEFNENLCECIGGISDDLVPGYYDLFLAKVNFEQGDYDLSYEYTIKAETQTIDKRHFETRIEVLFLRMRIFIVKGKYSDLKLTYSQLKKESRQNISPYITSMMKFIENWFMVRFYDITQSKSTYYNNRGEVYQNSVDLKSQELINHTYMFISIGEYKHALNVVTTIENDIDNYKNKWITQVNIYILKAICFYELGEKTDAYYCLWRAYDMTNDNNIISPYIEYGSYMRNMMNNIRKYSPCNFDETWISTIKKKSSYYTKQLTNLRKEYLIENDLVKDTEVRLTKREMEVLKLLAQGNIIKDISKQLFISMSTTKKHLASIYEKLGAVNRADAIRIASNYKII